MITTTLVETPIRILVDANILYSQTKMRWLFFMTRKLSQMQLWISEDILAETRYNLRRDNPLAGSDLYQWEDKIPLIFGEQRTSFLARSSYNHMDHGVKDIDDLHVHFAALDSGMDILLTDNVKDFPSIGYQKPYRVSTLDAFLHQTAVKNPKILESAIAEQQRYYQRNHQEALLSAGLYASNCPQLASLVEPYETEPLD